MGTNTPALPFYNIAYYQNLTTEFGLSKIYELLEM